MNYINQRAVSRLHTACTRTDNRHISKKIGRDRQRVGRTHDPRERMCHLDLFGSDTPLHLIA